MAAVMLLLASTSCGGDGGDGSGGTAGDRAATAAAPARGPRILLIGIDGADWRILRPLFEDGTCPNLARLAAASALGSLDSPPPRISPILWTGMFTGRQPEDHGVLDFLEPGPDGAPRPVSSRARKVDAVWSVLSRQGVRSGVVGFWATWPAEPIEGIVVSDAFAPSLVKVAESKALVFPPDWQERLAPLRDDEAAGDALLPLFVKEAAPGSQASPAAEGETDAPATEGALVPRDPETHLRAILRGTMAYHRASLQILEAGDVDVLLVYHQMVDEVCHRFMRHAPPVMPGVPADERARYGGAVRAAYALEDRLVGELLAKVGPETAVIVVSDHGFLSGEDRPLTDSADFAGQASAWHRDEAVVMIRASTVRPGAPLSGSVLDVAATIVALAGLPGALPGTALAGTGPRIPPRPASSRAAIPSSPDDAATPADGAAAARIAELEALGYVSRGASSAELTANAHVNLGNALTFRGRHAEARASYEKALAIDPEQARALYDMAASLHESGDAAGALPYLERLARLPGRVPPGALLRYAVIVARTPDAVAAAGKLLAARPEQLQDGEWHGALGLLLAAAGKRGEARAALVRSLEMGTRMAPPILALLALSPGARERQEARDISARAIGATRDRLVLESLRAGLAAQGEPDLARLAEQRLRNR